MYRRNTVDWSHSKLSVLGILAVIGEKTSFCVYVYVAFVVLRMTIQCNAS